MCALTRKRPERFAMRIGKGVITPSDQLTVARLRNRGYHVGDLVFIEIKKPRNPGFHRLAYQLAGLVAENIDAFSGLKPHAVLKRLQIESGVGCDEIGLRMPGIGPVMYRVPQSLSYESMDDGEFREVLQGFCRYIVSEYWPSVTPERIEAMSQCWVEAA